MTFEEWCAVASPREQKLHSRGRRIRKRLDEGGEVLTEWADREALAVYDAQQAGCPPAQERPGATS